MASSICLRGLKIKRTPIFSLFFNKELAIEDQIRHFTRPSYNFGILFFMRLIFGRQILIRSYNTFQYSSVFPFSIMSTITREVISALSLWLSLTFCFPFCVLSITITQSASKKFCNDNSIRLRPSAKQPEDNWDMHSFSSAKST